MRIRFLTVLILFTASPFRGQAQFDLSNYFNDNSFSMLDLTDHQDVEFKWTLKGKLQVNMNEGINEYAEGNIGRALLNLDELIKTDSSFWPAFYYRGLCKKNTGDLKGAQKDFLKAIELNDKIYQTHIELGEIYHYRRQYPKAKDSYETAEDLIPNSAMPIYMLGALALSKGDIFKAQNTFEKCNKIDPGFAPAYVSLGILKLRVDRKDVDKNLDLFNKAIRADSSFKPAYFWRGMILVKAGQNEKGLRDFSKMISLMPDNPLALQIRGFLLIELGRYDDAFIDLKKVMMSQDFNEKKYMTGETVLNKKIDLKKAAIYLIRKGYGLQEGTFELVKKAYCLMLIDKNSEALAALNEANRAEPNAPTYLMKGLAFEQLKLYDSALNCFNKTIALDNDQYEAYQKRAIYRFELKDLRGVYKDFMEMKRVEPQSITTLRLSGLLKAGLKDYYGCLVDLSMFIKKDSSDQEAWATRAFCRGEIRDHKGAISDYQQALTLNPKVPGYYDEIVKNNFILKDTLAALRTLNQLQSVYKTDSEITIEIAEVMASVRKYDSASILLNKVQDRIKSGYTPVYMSYLLYVQGKVLVGQSELEKGIKKVEQSIKLDEHNADKIFYRSKLYLKAGRMKDAIKDFQKLQSMGYAPAGEFYAKYLK